MGEQNVWFHWFDAADENEAALIASLYAAEHKLTDRKINLWCPELGR